MTYPYEDTTTEVLAGEYWKDVVGYEGYYQVSSLGRVKSVDRIIPHPRLGFQTVRGRILKQKVVVNINTISEDKMVDLQVSLSHQGKQHYRNVRRLVYAAFVRQIDYSRDGRYVINQDCDGYNNQVENIVLVSREEKSRRARNRGRVPESYLAYADRSEWEMHGGASRRKPVRQLTLEGQVVAEYESITEACHQTGVDENTIIDVAKGRRKPWTKFLWQYV